MFIHVLVLCKIVYLCENKQKPKAMTTKTTTTNEVLNYEIVCDDRLNDGADNLRLYCDENTMFAIVNHMNFDDDKFRYSAKRGQWMLLIGDLDYYHFSKLYDFIGEVY